MPVSKNSRRTFSIDLYFFSRKGSKGTWRGQIKQLIWKRYRGEKVYLGTVHRPVSWVPPGGFLACPGAWAPRERPSSGRVGRFAWSFPPIFMLIHPVACVLLDMPLFPPTLLWGEITFSGPNSHLISFIFKPASTSFLLCFSFSWAHAPLSLSRLSQKAWARHLVTTSSTGLRLWGAPSSSSCSGCREPGFASKGRETFSSAHVPVFNGALHSYLLLPLWAVCKFPLVSTFLLSWWRKHT